MPLPTSLQAPCVLESYTGPLWDPGFPGACCHSAAWPTWDDRAKEFWGDLASGIRLPVFVFPFSLPITTSVGLNQGFLQESS